MSCLSGTDGGSVLCHGLAVIVYCVPELTVIVCCVSELTVTMYCVSGTSSDSVLC